MEHETRKTCRQNKGARQILTSFMTPHIPKRPVMSRSFKKVYGFKTLACPSAWSTKNPSNHWDAKKCQKLSCPSKEVKPSTLTGRTDKFKCANCVNCQYAVTNFTYLVNGNRSKTKSFITCKIRNTIYVQYGVLVGNTLENQHVPLRDKWLNMGTQLKRLLLGILKKVTMTFPPFTLQAIEQDTLKNRCGDINLLRKRREVFSISPQDMKGDYCINLGGTTYQRILGFLLWEFFTSVFHRLTNSLIYFLKMHLWHQLDLITQA